MGHNNEQLARSVNVTAHSPFELSNFDQFGQIYTRDELSNA